MDLSWFRSLIRRFSAGWGNEMTLIPMPGSNRNPFSAEGQVREELLEVEEQVQIQEVSIFAEDGPNGKTLFSILLRFDSESDPSNRKRRTVTITGLTLGVEEKEIPVLARLAGRSLSIFLEKSQASLRQEQLEDEISLLKKEIERLQVRNKALTQNFHHVVDQSFKIS